MVASGGEGEHHWLSSLRGRILLSVGFALVVLTGLTLFADSRKLADVLRGFRWPLLVPILLLTSFNYALRFVKWQYYLHRVGITDLPAHLSARIFFANFTMAMTPGKIGEVFKSHLLREAIGTPIAVSAPIILVERLTDGIAMLFLASTGLIIFRYGVPVFAAIAVFGTPDWSPVTMILVAVPMAMLYEFSIVLCRIFIRPQAKTARPVTGG